MILPRARDCMDNTSQGGTYSAYEALALSQIATALGTAGTYSCTLTKVGKAGADVALVKEMLRQQGFRWTETTTTITILWDNSSPAVAISY